MTVRLLEPELIFHCLKLGGVESVLCFSLDFIKRCKQMDLNSEKFLNISIPPKRQPKIFVAAYGLVVLFN